MITFDVDGRMSIYRAVDKALALTVNGDSARFLFNDLEIIAAPGESSETVLIRYREAHEKRFLAHIHSPEYRAREIARLRAEIAELERE